MNENTPATSGRSQLYISIAAIGVAFLLFTFGWWTMPSPDDVELYSEYSRLTLNGQLPYRDFSIEYPPFALPFIVLPGLINNLSGAPSQTLYILLYQAEAYLLAVGTMVITWLLYQKIFPGKPTWRILRLLTLCMMIFSFYLFRRYDISATFLTVLSLYLFTLKKPGWGGVTLGLAAATKLYPAIIFPLVFIYYWKIARERKTARRATLGFTVAGVVVVLPFLIIGPSGIKGFIEYHGGRGVQAESLYSIISWFGKLTGLVDVQATVDHNSLNYASVWSGFLSSFSTLLTVGGLLAFYAYLWWKSERKPDFMWLVHTSIMATLWFILCNKVFSPQYLVWVLPYVVFWRGARANMYIAALCLSFLIFPVLAREMTVIAWNSMLAITARYLLVAGIFVLEWRELHRAPVLEPAPVVATT